jgi:dihydrolipoamide dehydrogenase
MLEMLDAFLPAADEAVAKEAWRIFTREQKLDIVLGASIARVAVGKTGVTVDYGTKGGGEQKLECDRLIVSIGRVPNTAGLSADKVGLKLDPRGYLEVDEHCRTNLPRVWGIGDVVRGPMLAHKAEDEGVAVAERIAGKHGHVDFNTVPWVIYTAPEIAWVGKTEQQLRSEGVQYRSGQFPFMANGRARALGDTRGFVKFVADAATDRILGVHIIGPMASETISEAVVAMEFRASAEDIGLICHAHPSLSEAMKEAALAVAKRSLNY